MPGDVVILSSTPIPGNEKAVARVINELSMKGAEVINQDTHVSGHACQEEIKLMYSLVRPKFSIPVHGEYRHLMAQRNLAISMGIPKENVILMRSGDVIEIGMRATARLPTMYRRAASWSMVWALVMSEISFCATARTWHRTVSLSWY